MMLLDCKDALASGGVVMMVSVRGTRARCRVEGGVGNIKGNKMMVFCLFLW